jgi:UDP-N-acetylmuramoyl-tripeptide--D-alanyl-D-alanine ligase
VTEQLAAAARVHRSELRVRFVAITGSCGKTTTKDLAAGMLAGTRAGAGSPGSENCGTAVARNVLGVRPGDDFFIQELGAWGVGTLDAGLELVRPEIGVVLNVRRDHHGQFHDLAHTQAEKAKVVEVLPPTGVAILNADDPRVWAMRERTRARVIGVGASAGAELRISDVRSAWPDRLSFELSAGGLSRRVRTQLLGTHLAGSAVTAIAIAHVLGASLDDAIERLAALPPTSRRMSATTIGPDITVVRDDFKAASDSLEETLRFLDEARAVRKVAVIGRISDHPGRSRGVYDAFARAAAELVDLLVFVGERPESLWGGDRRSSPRFLAEYSASRARVELFATVREAAQFLQRELRTGDLVVVKGSGPSDHLERVMLVHQTTVRCWRASCGLVLGCDSCERLGVEAEPLDPLPLQR